MMRSEQGFTLIEIMMAMTLLSIILMSLTGLTFAVSRQSFNSSMMVHRTAALTEVSERFGAMPFDSIDTYAGCATISDGPLPHEWCVTVQDVASDEKRLRVVVTPTDTDIAPDSLIVDRARTASANPFNVQN